MYHLIQTGFSCFTKYSKSVSEWYHVSHNASNVFSVPPDQIRIMFHKMYQHVSKFHLIKSDIFDLYLVIYLVLPHADMFISRRKHEPAHYMLKIDSFSLLCEAATSKTVSDVFEARGHKWSPFELLDLFPNKGGHISLHVVICDTGSDSKGWEVCVDVNVNGHRTKFHETKMTWGFDKLISTESFMESENGYFFNDSCVFGVEIIEVPQFTRLDRCLLMTKPLPTMNAFTWTIQNFSSLTEKILILDAFKIGKVKWYLSLYPKGYGLGEGTHLSIFLAVYDAMSLTNGWKIFAGSKFQIKNQSTESDLMRGFDNWFCNSKSKGFPTFMLLSELIYSKNGFLLNDNLIVEVEFLLIAIRLCEMVSN
ncbi:hypothetical protein R6Q59_022873 [Mikania micrantha]